MTDLQRIIRFYLTFNKLRYNRNAVLDSDDSKDMSVLVKPTNKSPSIPDTNLMLNIS